MRLELKTSGGIATFPGLQKPVVLDTATLEAPESAELSRLVEAALLRTLPPQVPSNKNVRDARTYVLTVEDAGKRHTVTRSEPLAEPGLAALITFVRKHARG